MTKARDKCRIQRLEIEALDKGGKKKGGDKCQGKWQEIEAVDNGRRQYKDSGRRQRQRTKWGDHLQTEAGK